MKSRTLYNNDVIDGNVDEFSFDGKKWEKVNPKGQLVGKKAGEFLTQGLKMRRVLKDED